MNCIAQMKMVTSRQNRSMNLQRINEIINDILNEEIKDFFLFDAEKIDTLAKTDSKVKHEVKTAIFKLLQIENVEKATGILQRLASRQNRTIVEESKSVDLERKNKEIEELQNKIQSNITLQDRKEENLRLCNEEITCD